MCTGALEHHRTTYFGVQHDRLFLMDWDGPDLQERMSEPQTPRLMILIELPGPGFSWGRVTLEISHDSSIPVFTMGEGHNTVLLWVSDRIIPSFQPDAWSDEARKVTWSMDASQWPSRSWDGLSSRGTLTTNLTIDLEGTGLDLWCEQQCVNPETRAEIKASANGVSL